MPNVRLPKPVPAPHVHALWVSYLMSGYTTPPGQLERLESEEFADLITGTVWVSAELNTPHLFDQFLTTPANKRMALAYLDAVGTVMNGDDWSGHAYETMNGHTLPGEFSEYLRAVAAWMATPG